MFETAELSRTISKAEYDAAVPALRTDLLRVQNELRERADFSVVIVIGGVDGAGKGPTVNVLHEWMDPRFLWAHAFDKPSDEEAERPANWRFWRLLPPRGLIGMFFGSWYTQPILQRAYGESGDDALDQALRRIGAFEKGLVDDGTLVLKYWFHLSKKAQARRLKRLAKDPEQSWRVTKTDVKHFELYDTFRPICERALRMTSTGEAPWTVVEGFDARYRELTVGRHLLQSIEAHAESQRQGTRRRRSVKAPRVSSDQPTILDTVDLAATVPVKPYKKQLAALQAELAQLSRKAGRRGVSTALVFEGWDAAGKGGAVRRVTAALDARHYHVIPIAAPTDEERARHYLWRFWRWLPRAGHVVFFDRSWYGRVLVERVERLAREEEWMRAYAEINGFEEELHEHGMGIAKFWLHLSPEEQARRFAAREKTPYKKFKITEEDYRNREKWPLYEEAVNDMVERTHTEYAPWTLVAADDKRHARLAVLRRCCEVIREAIDRSKRRKPAR